MTSKLTNMVKESRLPGQDESTVRLKRSRRPQDGSDQEAAPTDTSSNQAAGYTMPGIQFASRRAPAVQENTFRTSSDVTFKAADVEHLAEDILVHHLKDVKYDPARCKRLSQELAARIMDRIKCLQLKRYKLVAVVSIGSIKERPGMQFGSRCLWNQDTDTFASVKFTNGSLFAVAMVYGLYYE